MSFRCLLLILSGLLISTSEADEIRRELSVADVAGDIPVIAAESLTKEQWADFVPVTRDQLAQWLQRYSRQQSTIEQTTYSARLDGSKLVDGKLTIQLPEQAAANSVSLGHANFSHLRLFAKGAEVPLAMHSEFGLIPLIRPDTGTLTGDWSATGVPRGRSIAFDLRLPSADISSMKITTDAQTQIRSPNAVFRSVFTDDSKTIWELFPANPSKLTIECQRVKVDWNERAFVSVNAQINLLLTEAECAWSIAVPKSLAGAKIRFRVAGDVTIERVSPDESDVRWRQFTRQDVKYLEADLPEGISGPLSVVGSFQLSADGKFHFPFLLPEAWSSTGPEQRIGLSTSDIRASVDSQVVVTQLELSGLYKKDVSFLRDRDFVMEFEQFAESASAAVSVTAAMPLVEDAVVVKIESMEANVDAFAYVRATARTGVVNTLSWDVPNNWRVTDVRELSPDNPPLLYRLVDDNAETTRLDVTLRSPLTLTSASQLLMVRMQSVELSPGVQQQPAGLFTSEYHRAFDQLALPAALAKRLISSWAAGSQTETDVTDASLWLPQEALTDFSVYARSDLKPVDSSSIPQNDIEAVINYSVDVTSTDVMETANVRLRSGAELPVRIPMTLSSDVVPELKSDDDSVALVRIGAGNNRQWVIETRAAEAGVTEVGFSLTAKSPLHSKADGMAIQFSNCRQTGRIVPPDSDFEVTMDLQTETLSRVVSSAMEYPNEPFTLELKRKARIVGPLQISGRGFVVISRKDERSNLDVICRCLVTSAGSSFVEFFLDAQHCDVLVEGREVHAEKIGRLFRVPLPEQQAQISVDVLFSCDVATDVSMSFPVVEFPNADAEISWHVMPESGQKLTSLKNLNPVWNSSLVAGELIGAAGLPGHNGRLVPDFASRWMLRAASQPACVVIPFVPDRGNVGLMISEQSSWIGRVLFFSTVVLLAWSWLTSFQPSRCGSVILLLLALRWVLTDSYGIGAGCLGGTLAYCVLSIGRKFIPFAPSKSQEASRQASKLVVSSLFVVLVPGIVFAQVDTTVPKIVAPGKDSPVVYVQRAWLDSLKALSAESATEVAVLETNLEVLVESPESASAKIKTIVAGSSDMPQHLVLPLGDATLVNCMLNGTAVFPRRNQSGETQVAINSEAVLPTRTLSLHQPNVVSGPGTLGEWSLHTVEYQVRLPVRVVNGELRLDVSVPMSPITTAILSDPLNLIREPRLKNPNQEFKGTGTGRYLFPATANLAEVEFVASLVNEQQATTASQDVQVTCAIDVLPDKLLTTTEYRVLQVEPDEQTLHLSVDPDSIVSVKSPTGVSIPWTAVRDGIEVTVPPDALNEQVAVVRLENATDLSLQKSLKLDDLRNVNRRLVSGLTAIVRTTDRFVVDEILGDGQMLPAVTSPDSESDTTRVVERRVIVPAEVQSLSVTIAERISTQLVEEVSLEAVVRDESIEWSCQFRSEITGQPAFRQSLLLPEEIRIEKVAATLLGTDRLQTWSRTKDSVVVFLREATRGTLLVQVKGTIPRIPGQPTRLPFAGFPSDVQVLQYSLELRSEASRGTFVSSFGGALPDENFAIDNPLSSTAIRLSVTEDSRPMLIRELQKQSAEVSVAVLVYETAGQKRTATAMLVKPADATAPLRFRSRSNDLESQRPIVLQNNVAVVPAEEGDVYTIPSVNSQAEFSSTVIVFPNGIPISRNDSLLVQTPEFEVATEVVSCVCYDLQTSVPINTRSSGIPAWVSESVKGLDLPGLQNGRNRSAQFDPVTRRVQIRQPQLDQNLPESTTAPGVFYVDCEHYLRPKLSGISGASSFLVFASQSRSDFIVRIPDDLIVMRISVDGKPVPLTRHEDFVTVTLPSRVSHIVADWIAETDSSPGRVSQEMSLPFVNSTHGRTRVAVNPGKELSRWWRVEAPAQSNDEFQDARTSSILTGLQMLEVEFGIEADSEFTTKSSMPENLISQIGTQSGTAAESADHLFARNEQAKLLIAIDGGTLILKDFRLPSYAMIGSLLLAVALIAAPWFGTDRVPSALPDTEESTIVRKASASDVVASDLVVKANPLDGSTARQ